MLHVRVLSIRSDDFLINRNFIDDKLLIWLNVILNKLVSISILTLVAFTLLPFPGMVAVPSVCDDDAIWIQNVHGGDDEHSQSIQPNTHVEYLVLSHEQMDFAAPIELPYSSHRLPSLCVSIWVAFFDSLSLTGTRVNELPTDRIGSDSRRSSPAWVQRSSNLLWNFRTNAPPCRDKVREFFE